MFVSWLKRSSSAVTSSPSAVATFRRAVTEGPIAQGLAALYAYESMVPAVAEEPAVTAVAAAHSGHG